MAWEKGQKVILSTYGSQTHRQIAVIERVTPTGRARIGKLQFDEHGRLMGGGMWDWATISAATEKDLEEVQTEQELRRIQGKTRSLLNKVRVSDLDMETCKALIALLSNKD